MKLWVRVIKKFGYHAIHTPGEIIKVELSDLTELIKEDFVEIVVNNVGNNKEYDEEESKPFTDEELFD